MSARETAPRGGHTAACDALRASDDGEATPIVDDAFAAISDFDIGVDFARGMNINAFATVLIYGDACADVVASIEELSMGITSAWTKTKTEVLQASTLRKLCPC